MKLFYCDFCCEEIEAPDTNNHKVNCQWIGMHGYDDKHYDLCATCFSKLYSFIDKKLYREKKK
jgi:hypothetical protein